MRKQNEAVNARNESKKKVTQPKAQCPKKQTNHHQLPEPVPYGEILTDVSKKQWRIGKSVGKGGFGEIYLASDDVSKPVSDNVEFVIKIEPHNNGPLFTEMHFYHKVAKVEMIQEWMAKKKLKYLGMPKFISFGSHILKNSKYRFLVMDRFGIDVQKMFEKSKYKFSLKTVLTLGIKLMDVLEYIHSKGYVHADIKASNLLLGYNKEDEVYLVDYGLAFKYISAGKHKPFSEDPRRAHNGTLEFTSRDAHVGAFSRRGDLEILGYNMVQWLCGKLPWEENLKDPAYVMTQKNGFMSSLPGFMNTCFKTKKYPVVESYLKYVCQLQFEQDPDYDYCKKLFIDGLKVEGLTNDGKFDFGAKSSPVKRKLKSVTDKIESENVASTLPIKKSKDETRQPCGLAQTNRQDLTKRSPRCSRKVQEPLKAEKKPQPTPKIDIPTPGMLQVMQLREERERQKNLSKQMKIKNNAGGKSNSSPRKTITSPQTYHGRRTRQNAHSHSDSLTENNYSFSPELF